MRSPLGRWGVRAGIVGACALVGAAGLATATFAGKGTVPQHDPPTTTVEQPPPPKAPPDPLTPPDAAPASSITDKMKSFSIADLRSVLVGVSSFLGDCLTPSELVDGASSTTDPVLCFVAAQAILTEAINLYNQSKDPPDPNFQQVALGAPAPVPTGRITCSKKATKSNCALAAAAWRKYLEALNVNAQVMGADTITLNRFSGAVEAKSVPGALLQAAAQKAYAGLLVSTKAAQQAAGTALALTLRKTKLDARPTAALCAARKKKLSTSKGLPRQVIDRLIADKQIQAAADLDPILQGIAAVPCVPLSTGVGQALPTGPIAELWHSMTFKDLAVLIRGLGGQGAIPGPTVSTLIEQLRDVANAAATSRKPLIDKLVKDAEALANKPAALLLSVGAAGLS